MGGIITPPGMVKFTDESEHLILLDGPIKGARHWQRTAANDIYHANPELWVASPRQMAHDTGDRVGISEDDQIDWTHTHLTLAGERGAILFWFPREYVHTCEQAYAQTSRFEIGEHLVLSIYKKYKVVVGIEPGFSGEHYLRRTIAKKYPHILVLDTLHDTCWYAAHMLYE
ncbi:MAG: hypothetical protein WCW78_00690 [Candidatus Paceibacterota bacterium]|jgi:hypothetical protein